MSPVEAPDDTEAGEVPDVDQAPAQPPEDAATAEALSLLEAVRAAPAAEPVGPAAYQVGKAACAALQLDPHKRAELTDDGAKAVRRALGIAAGVEVTNLDRYTAEAVEARAAARWQQLNERATAEGWHAANFARVHQLNQTDGEYVAWEAGRPMFDPTYRPPRPPEFGIRSFNPAAPPERDGARMDAALREAAAAARRQVREVEISGDRVTSHL